MTMNPPPKAAMDAAKSVSEPRAWQGALRASGNAPGLAVPLKAASPTMELVPRVQRRIFSRAAKRRILAAAGRCTMPGEMCTLLGREGVYASSLSTRQRQRETLELVALTPKRRGPKADPGQVEALHIATLTMQNARLQDRLDKAMLVIEVQKAIDALLGPMLGDNAARI